MPKVIRLSIGTRAAEAVTANSVSANGSYAWNVVLSASVPATVKKGDKFTDSAAAIWRVIGFTGTTLTVAKYFGTLTTSASAPVTGAGTIDRAFSNIQSWDDAAPTDITAAGIGSVEGLSGVVWLGEVYYDGAARLSTTATISISGTATDAECFKWLRGAPGDRWQDQIGSGRLYWNTPGAGIVPTNSSAGRISVADDYTLIEDLVLHHNNSSYAQQILTFGTGANNSWVRGCIMGHANGGSISTAALVQALAGVVIANNFIFDYDNASTAEAIGTTGTGSVYCLFNTIARPSDASPSPGGTIMYPAVGAANTVYFHGNAVFGFQTREVNTQNTWQSGYNACNNASGFLAGTTNAEGLTYTAQFVNTTTAAADFRAVDTGSLDNAAIPFASLPSRYYYDPDTDAQSQITAIDTDAFGNNRGSTPWIGAYQPASAAPIDLASNLQCTAAITTASLTTAIPLAAVMQCEAALIGSVVSVPRILISLVDSLLAPMNVDNIRYSVWAETAGAHALATKLTSGTTELTDASGLLSIDVPGGTIGQQVTLVLDDALGRGLPPSVETLV